MANRRQFLGFGIAASVWPVAALPFGRSRAHGAPVGPVRSHVYKAICDGRYAAAAAFAARMSRHGVPIQGIDGDVTSVWFNDLALRWREAPAAVAGLTSAETLFCLEQLAWDHRLRVVFRGERAAGAGGRVEARIEGPERVIGRAERRDPRQGTGVSHLAELALRCPDAAMLPGPRNTLSVRAPRDATDGPWVAWVIAPVRRRSAASAGVA